MYKSHFNITAFIKTRVDQSVEHRATNRKVVGASPIVDKIFLNLHFVAFDVLLAGRLAPYK